MKLLIISDIHSNLPNLNAVLAKEADADQIYCAGDLVDVGLDPCGVVDRIRKLDIPCVRGNHDEKVCEIWRNGVDTRKRPESFAELNASLLDAERVRYLESLPERITFSCDGVSYLMQHLYHGYELITSDYGFDEFWGESHVDPGLARRCIILGHTHHQAECRLSSERSWINPGSIGYNRPSDPFPGTRYLTVVNGDVYFHRLEHPDWRSRQALQREFDERFRQREEKLSTRKEHTA